MKTPVEGVNVRDNLRDVITSWEDKRFALLLDIAKMAVVLGGTLRFVSTISECFGLISIFFLFL